MGKSVLMPPDNFIHHPLDHVSFSLLYLKDNVMITNLFTRDSSTYIEKQIFHIKLIYFNIKHGDSQ